MKTVINYKEVQWVWKEKPIKISKLKTKDIKYLKFLVKVNSDKKQFWFGLHYQFWLEVFNNELVTRKKLRNVSEKEPISKNQIAKNVDRFLGNITEHFPNSNLAKSIKSNQINYNSLVKS